MLQLVNITSSIEGRYIMKANPKLMIIMVAHRLSTLNDCDYVLNLEGGEIKEYGRPLKILKPYI